jgi:predicted unusual protein kinase regulating ubiquinone biosynthesis (AarF/ABC1/UbiB family)
MPISLSPKHLTRYREIAALVLKYGRGDLAKELGKSPELRGLSSEAKQHGSGRAEELAADLERLGPTFVKLGQLLSTRADLLPPAYLDALSRLQDSVEPFPFEVAADLVQTELGVRLSKAFASFEEKPIAAASLGQVHRATLRDGRPVAVKVQRPLIRERILDDLTAFREIAEILDNHTDAGKRYGFTLLVDEFRRSILDELDYQKEAQNLVVLRHEVEEFDRLVVPMPVESYSSARVLTMELVPGRKVTELSPLVRLDVDGSLLAEQLFEAYLKQILVNGFFHADPHPGNVFVTDDGRIALIDLGMVSRIPAGMRERLLKLVLALSEGNGEEVAELVMRLGQVRAEGDVDEMKHRISDLVATIQGATVEELKTGRLVLELAGIAAGAGIRLPSELTMLGKTLVNLDEVGRALDPSFDPNASIRRNAATLFEKRLKQPASTGGAVAALLETKELIQKMPDRVNRVLDLLASNRLKVNVDAIDEMVLLEGLQKIANRIALGVVVAALIVGAALLMQVPTDFRIFGYPGLAMLFFLIAAAGGVALSVAIVLSDRRRS